MYICMKKLNGDINIHTSSKDIHFYVDSGTKGHTLLRRFWYKRTIITEHNLKIFILQRD